MKLRTLDSKGFTLVELLVVLVLTVIVMGLVFGPLTQVFNLTRRGEAQIQAQSGARRVAPLLKRDLSEALYVYDNTRDSDRINFYVRNKSGEASVVLCQYAKVDMVLPRMKAYCTASNGKHNVNTVSEREFDRGDEAQPTCPIDGSVLQLRPVQPLAPDSKIVRWFIGLADPTRCDATHGDYPSYCNRFMHLGTTPNNMYVLYRVEFNPEAADADRYFPASDDTFSKKLNDPNFFYNQGTNNYKVPGTDVDETYASAWRRIARPMLTVSNTDLIRLEFDDSGNPIVTPMVTFGPTAIFNDPLVPTTEKADRPEQGDSAPTVYRAKYGQWVGGYEITVRRDADNIWKTKLFHDDAANRDYMGIYRTTDSATPIFDISRYNETSKGPDPDDGSWTGYRYKVGKISPEKPEMAFTCDTSRGEVNFAFPHVDLDLSASLPSVLGLRPTSLAIDTADVNDYYNTAATEGSLQERYRVWEFHHPASRTLPLTGYSFSEDRVLGGDSVVVPGMEVVVGPDSNRGDSYGDPILYTRTPFWNPTAEPSINQYKLDVDYPVLNANDEELKEMSGTAAIYLNSQLTETGEGIALPEASMIQSLRGTTDGTISKLYLLYYEQNNAKGDTLWASYVTKSKMTVNLNVRVYDPTTGQPQSTQVSFEYSLKNIAR